MTKQSKLILFSIFFIIILFWGTLFYFFNPIEKIKYLDEKVSDNAGALSLAEVDKEYLEEYVTKEQKLLDVFHYDISIELIPEQKLIKGKTIITGVMPTSSEKLILNFYDNMNISSLLLNGMSAAYKRTDTKIQIEKEASQKDSFIVEINYSGTPKSLGFGSFVMKKINGKYFVYTLNEPVYASTWFPCNDNPADKALLDIKIMNDSIFTSVSNGVLVGSKTIGNKKEYHWKTYYPIATYLITLYSADYSEIKDKYINGKDTLQLTHYVLPEKLEDARKDFSEHPKWIKFFESKFGRYPFQKEKYGVAEFLWQAGAMEHQTITGIGSNYISGHRFFSDLLIHELAHQWWGNALTPKSWKDIWLNEGFATYSEALYWEYNSGSDALVSTMASKPNSFKSSTLYDPEINLFSRLVYDKGAWVLHMLRYEVGEDNFFKILRTYFDSFKYKNVETKDFIAIAEKISGKNLKKFFDQWVFKGKGMIELNYSYFLSDNSVKLNLTQIQKEYPEYKFDLDVEILFSDNSKIKERLTIDKKDYHINIPVNKKPMNLTLDPDFWLLAKYNNQN
ncbi:MAG: M1 family metallopeptidase [Melioribacteraceae bacterium]|nr:M1 family metallopeptidase [Melioribacteraceae bacterium]